MKIQKKTKREKEKNIPQKYKRASIGSTLTWVVALFIIIFFSILFILGCSILGKGDELIDLNNKIILDYNTNLIFQESFFGFLETKINFNDQEIKIINLVSQDLTDNQGIEKFGKFRELSEKFLEENAKEYYKSWIRIYEQDTIPFQFFFGEKYQEFEAYYGISAPAANPCHPDKGTILFNFPLLKNKKIIICLEPKS